jgi:acyl-CoA:acyl-CoA alkyltransferase
MHYTKVYVDTLGYELPPVVMTTDELEERLEPLLAKLHVPKGEIERLTGIAERRWWDEGYSLSKGAAEAARKALASSQVPPGEIDILIYGGVCRENFEPATACCVAASLGISTKSLIYDVSNACLGVLNGIIDVANRIELGQSRAGLVVSAESAREINEIAIARMLQKGTMEHFIGSLATLTGGSGAVAVLLTDGSFSTVRRRKLLGGISCAEPQYHRLCRWGIDREDTLNYSISMYTDSTAVLKHGVELGKMTWAHFLETLQWNAESVERVICHQVGSSHQETILKTLGIDRKKDFVTYPFLGNIGTVSLPMTAAIAEERGFLIKGQRVAFLGIGSGLNCMMLGWEW